MEETTFVLRVNFNRLESAAWIEKRLLPDGGYELIGMGRLTEFDAKTGAIVSNKIEPTGVRGYEPPPYRKPRFWWRRLLQREGVA